MWIGILIILAAHWGPEALEMGVSLPAFSLTSSPRLTLNTVLDPDLQPVT